MTRPVSEEGVADPLTSFISRSLRAEVSDVSEEIIQDTTEAEIDRVSFTQGDLRRSLIVKRVPPHASLEVKLLPHLARKTDRVPVVYARGIPPETVVVERGDVLRAKPEPDLFLACQERLGVAIRDCYVVGDAVWDLLAARRAGMLSVGLLSGGYGEDELTRAGAFRVYRDAAELRGSLDELGVLN